MNKQPAHSASSKILIEEIEEEAAKAGEDSCVGPLWVTPNWVIVLRPSLAIYRLSDVIGVGGRLEATKTGGPVFQLHFWIRDRMLSDEFDIQPLEAVEILKRFREVRPVAVVDAFEVFEKRWNRDRKGCAADVDARSS